MEVALSREKTTQAESKESADKPPKRRVGPSSKKLPPPLGQNQNPSPVRHDSVLSESIVTVGEQFRLNFYNNLLTL